MIIGGYDTDDLTNRQYHYFCILNKKATNNAVNMFAYNFLASCVKQNFSRNKFDNYDGDCVFLFRERNKQSSINLGINLDEVYS